MSDLDEDHDGQPQYFSDIYRDCAHMTDECLALEFESIAVRILTENKVSLGDLYYARSAINQAIYLRSKKYSQDP